MNSEFSKIKLCQWNHNANFKFVGSFSVIQAFMDHHVQYYYFYFLHCYLIKDKAPNTLFFPSNLYFVFIFIFYVRVGFKL